jgi:hypothetical protein
MKEINLKKLKRIIKPEDSYSLLYKSNEEAHITIHCLIKSEIDTRIRLWKNIKIVDRSLIYEAKLIHAENISFHPQWTNLKSGEVKVFTLIFESLPKQSKRFDLVESIPESGGFVKLNIARNKTDVYKINLN